MKVLITMNRNTPAKKMESFIFSCSLLYLIFSLFMRITSERINRPEQNGQKTHNVGKRMRGCLTPDFFSRLEYPSVCESAKIFRSRSTDVCFSTAWHRRNLYWLSGGTESRGQFQTKKRERAKRCVIETQRNFTYFQSIALTTHRAAKKKGSSIVHVLPIGRKPN